LRRLLPRTPTLRYTLPMSRSRDTFALFDAVFKKLLRLSRKAVIAFINGLFGTDYPPTATVEYPNTETVSTKLRRRISDAYLKVQGQTYHVEMQSTVDNDIIIRVFEAGFGYARDEKTFDGDVRVLRLPAARIIQIQGEVSRPQVLRLIFPDGSRHDYTVEVLNLLRQDVMATASKGLALLLPFYALKLRRDVEAAKTSEARRRLAPRMEALLDSLRGALAQCVENGIIEGDDLGPLLGWLKKLSVELYSQYNELAEEVLNMELVNPYDEYVAERTKEVAQEVTKEVTKEVTEEVTKEVTKKVTKEVKEQTRRETARRSLALGIAPEKAAKISGLSLAKVRALAVQPSAPARKRGRAKAAV